MMLPPSWMSPGGSVDLLYNPAAADTTAKGKLAAAFNTIDKCTTTANGLAHYFGKYDVIFFA